MDENVAEQLCPSNIPGTECDSNRSAGSSMYEMLRGIELNELVGAA